MLQELGVSKGAYHIELCEENEVRVSMLFNASMLPLEGSPVYILMSRIQSKDYEIAQDTTCIKARRYIEEATNTVIRDWNYTRLKELEEQNKSLVHGRIQEKKPASSWFLAVGHMSSFSQQVAKY